MHCVRVFVRGCKHWENGIIWFRVYKTLHNRLLRDFYSTSIFSRENDTCFPVEVSSIPIINNDSRWNWRPNITSVLTQCTETQMRIFLQREVNFRQNKNRWPDKIQRVISRTYCSCSLWMIIIDFGAEYAPSCCDVIWQRSTVRVCIAVTAGVQMHRSRWPLRADWGSSGLLAWNLTKKVQCGLK